MEDELGDVLEKAMRRAGLTEEALSQRVGVSTARILDAIDYRPDLTADELRTMARVLGLNEIGLCALGCGQYPLPAPEGLPFCVYPLRMRHGIGVANAYLVADCGADRGVLFDTGPGSEALTAVWPRAIRAVDAVFITHVEAEHAGGLCSVVERFAVEAAFCPVGERTACGRPIADGTQQRIGNLAITAYSTPGHTRAHNCYVVESVCARRGTSLLISGDLFFAGSVGGATHCADQLLANVRRMLALVPATTVIAPGHGPMTTAANELRFNPFLG